MNRLFFVIASTPALADVCSRLCDAFTANLRGNGEDLCQGATSICYQDITGAEFCSNLFYSTTEDGARGLFYESDSSTLTQEELSHPVSCQDAEEIIYVPGNFQDVGLRIFVSSEPVQRWLGTQSPTLISELLIRYNQTASWEYFSAIWENTHSINDSSVVEEMGHINRTVVIYESVFDAIRYLASATNTRALFDSRLARVIHCHGCNSDIYENYSIRADYRGAQDVGLADHFRTLLEMSTAARVAFHCPHCDLSGVGSLSPISLNRTSDVLSIRVGGTHNIVIPHELNVTQIVPSFTNQPGYRLLAIVSGNRPRIQIDGQWFLIGRNGSLTRTSHPGVVVTDNDTDFVFYQRIES